MPTRSTKSRPIPTPPTAPVLRYVENDPVAENEEQVSGELDSIESHKLDPVGSIPTPATSTLLSLRVVKLAPNASFVLCAFDGIAVPVKVRRGMGSKLLKKTIQVERLEDGTLTHRP